MRDFVKKTVIINRAVPGSGKTTISNCIISFLQSKDIDVAIHSTDEYFMTDDRRYEFSVERLFSFHMLNLSSFTNSLKSNVPVVICDNINIAPWQTKPYTDVAREYGYRIIFITFAPRELEKHVLSQKVTPEKPDAHGVPEGVLVRFMDEYNLYNPLLDPNHPVDPDIHKDYYWDQTKNIRVECEAPISHFDTDQVIEIMPDQYHWMKDNIGRMLTDILAAEEGGVR